MRQMLYESYLFMSGMHSFSFSYFSCLQNFVAFDPTFCLETFLDCWCNRSNLSVCSTHSLIVAAVDRDPSVNWIASSIALSIHCVLSVRSIASTIAKSICHDLFVISIAYSIARSIGRDLFVSSTLILN